MLRAVNEPTLDEASTSQLLSMVNARRRRFLIVVTAIIPTAAAATIAPRVDLAS